MAIHPHDRPLLGMQWRGKYFVDLVLPFGLRSAPFIFTSIVDLDPRIHKSIPDSSTFPSH